MATSSKSWKTGADCRVPVVPTAPEWRTLLKPGSKLWLAGGAGCPHALMAEFLTAARAVGDLELITTPVPGANPWLDAACGEFVRVNGCHLDSKLAAAVNRGAADYTPVHASDLSDLLRERIIRIDTALIQVGPPDPWGFCALGPTVGHTLAACDAATRIVAQINAAVPRIGGLGFVHLSRIHAAICAESPLPAWQPEPLTEAPAIARYIAQLVNDGDTLQFPVDAIGGALAEALAHHRRLGIHCEMLGDAVMALFERGVIDNGRKTLLPGKLIATQALGSAALYTFLDGNPHCDLRPAEFVCNPLTIARNERMVAINRAAMVDLTGQVALDAVNGRFRHGFGSTVDFVRGAAMSRQGRPVIALPATGIDPDGTRYSRIVAGLPADSGVGCNRADIYHVVTEFGIATLRGRSVQERAQELIQIAHPDFREPLLAAARSRSLVAPWFQLSPPVTAAGESGPHSERVRLRDGLDYLLRPLHSGDDRRLQTFFYSHSEETIIRRYGFTVTRMTRARASELVGIDQNRDLALAIIELRGPQQIIHAVGRYYLDTDGRSAEMAFVVAEDKRRAGMARTLLEHMTQIARHRGLHHLWAQVDRDNTAMLRLFRSVDARELPGGDPHTVRIEISLRSSADDPPPAAETLKSLFARR
jgi:acyl-CoA hydrolase/RimJ/RimL family protein N-acetyltransferase